MIISNGPCKSVFVFVVKVWKKLAFKITFYCGMFDLNRCLVKTVVENTFQKIISYNCLFKSVVEVEDAF
jgi:hypothetical protein